MKLSCCEFFPLLITTYSRYLFLRCHRLSAVLEISCTTIYQNRLAVSVHAEDSQTTEIRLPYNERLDIRPGISHLRSVLSKNHKSGYLDRTTADPVRDQHYTRLIEASVDFHRRHTPHTDRRPRSPLLSRPAARSKHNFSKCGRNSDGPRTPESLGHYSRAI